MRLLGIAVLFVFGSMPVAWAGKQFVPPQAAEAGTYPAHDEHPSEHVTIAIELYNSAEKAGIFKVNWQEHGYLPVYFVVTNDSNQPIALAGMQVDWMTANHSKLLPASDDDLARRIAHIKHRGDEPTPLPLPTGPKVGLSKEARQEITAAQFHARAVAPHTTQAGFLFFDIEGIREPLAGAEVYVTGIKDAQGRDLMYFELPVKPDVSAPVTR